MRDAARLAAWNNAEWCDAVSAAHGAPGRFEPGFWINPGDAPPYYPNMVTLEPGDGDAQRRAVAERASRPGGFGVKDSFAALDLADLGLSIAFVAEWLWLEPAAVIAADETDLTTRIVTDAAALADWERAWGDDAEAAPIFAPSLLSDGRVAFIAVERAGETVAGAALNRSERVVGISNVFVLPGTDEAAALVALVATIRALHLALPIVGYERGDMLALFGEAGFRAVGALRVWVR